MPAFALKLIALITMIIDHIDKILIANNSVTWQVFDVYHVIVLTGRMAFPIYAFLIAEGCRKTRNMPKYIFRLFLFMIISEIFYIMAFYNNDNHGLELIIYAFRRVSTLRFRNIFTTLMFGVISIYAYQLLSKLTLNKILHELLTASVLFIIMLITNYFGGSYGILGIALIFLLYCFNSRTFQAVVIVIWSAVFYLLWASFNGSNFLFLVKPVYLQWFIFASFSAIPIILYNGERGKSLKWAFYIAYPLHLLILTAIREIIY